MGLFSRPISFLSQVQSYKDPCKRSTHHYHVAWTLSPPRRILGFKWKAVSRLSVIYRWFHSLSLSRLVGSAPPPDPRFFDTLQWLLQQESEKQSPQPPSPGIMIHSPSVCITLLAVTNTNFLQSSSPDNILGPEYSFTTEYDNDPGSWTMTAPMYPTGPQIQFNAPLAQPPRLSPFPVYADDWSQYQPYDSPNENLGFSSSNFMMMNNIKYSPNTDNSLSPFSIQPRTHLSLPQLSSANSDSSLSPSYGTSCLSTPTTPASATQSFMPSPTLSQVDHMHQQDSQAVTLDVCGSYLFIPFYWFRVHSLIDLVTLIANNYKCSAKL